MFFAPISLIRPITLPGNQYPRPLAAKVQQGDTVHFLGRPIVSQTTKKAFVQYVKNSEQSTGLDARQPYEIKDSDYLKRLRNQFVNVHPFTQDPNGQQDKTALLRVKPATLENWVMRADWQEEDSNIETL
jgi:hypothetical protein